MRRLAIILVAPLLLAGARAPHTPPRCEAPAIEQLPDGRFRTTLDVMTFNIEGLGFPVRTKREPKLAEIGRRIAAMRAAGDAPDVILFQEAFSGAARSAIRASGYPELARGPGRNLRRDLPAAKEERGGAGKRSIKRGEIGLKFTSGGLAIASRYPIEVRTSEPFASKSCAGFDCFANKGALFARIVIPGAPDPVDLFNTHMNARKASGAPLRRTLPIHQAQARELANFIDATNDADYPTVLGGDFNMRNSEARFDFLEPIIPLRLVHRFCLQSGAGCDIRMSWDGDEPWLDTQDLQFFHPGRRVDIRPVRIEAVFDGSEGSPRLSDHDAYRVVYELTWRADATTASAPNAKAASEPVCTINARAAG